MKNMTLRCILANRRAQMQKASEKLDEIIEGIGAWIKGILFAGLFVIGFLVIMELLQGLF
jgi:hypothetical protein